nr:threonine synthase [Lachnospiraceae bacterium]
MNHVKTAVCVKCGAEHEATPNLTTCRKCGGILDIRYDYDGIRSSLSKSSLKERDDFSMWRYKEFLPVDDAQLAGGGSPSGLRVGWSPLYKAHRLAGQLGLSALYVKDDGI